MFVILPFEKAFYKKYDYDADFVGHPLLDVTEHYVADTDFRAKNGLSEKPIIALLPGSRKQEISRMLSGMLEMIKHFPDYQFVVAGAPSQPASFYEPILETAPSDRVKLVSQQSYDLLKNAAAALVTSGTATLETALFRVPQVVCYRGNSINYFLAKRLINVKYISLVNLIVDKPLVKELIQEDFNTEELSTALSHILEEKNAQNLVEGYEDLIKQLGQSGASARTASKMVNCLAKNPHKGNTV